MSVIVRVCNSGMRENFYVMILDRLDELIHGSETAKRTLRGKDEEILIDGQKKWKSTKKDKENLKKQKK